MSLELDATDLLLYVYCDELRHGLAEILLFCAESCQTFKGANLQQKLKFDSGALYIASAGLASASQLQTAAAQNITANWKSPKVQHLLLYIKAPQGRRAHGMSAQPRQHSASPKPFFQTLLPKPMQL